jgi:ABC-type proline/glycine betaine transport system substrate-binding protein
MRALVLTGAAVVAALALAWTAGLQHQANCVHAGRVSCSVLPWDDGQRAMKAPSDGFGGEGDGFGR